MVALNSKRDDAAVSDGSYRHGPPTTSGGLKKTVLWVSLVVSLWAPSVVCRLNLSPIRSHFATSKLVLNALI